MINLPYLPKPREDELIWSYLKRVTDFYAGNMKIFSDHLCTPKFTANRTDIPNPVVLNYEMNEYMAGFAEALNIAPSAVLEKMTLWPFWFSFMAKERQARYIDFIFKTYTQKVNPTPNQRLKELHYCPECAKEDQDEYGNIILYRSHQLPGVKACFKHGCELLEYKQKEGIENSKKASQRETDFAQFAHSYLGNMPFKSEDDLIDFFKSNVANAGFESMDDLLSQMKKIPYYKPLFAGKQFRAMDLWNGTNYRDEEIILKALYFMSTKGCQLPDSKDEKNTSLEDPKIVESSCFLTIYKDFENDRLLYQHPDHYEKHWPCGYDQEKTDEEIFSEIIKAETNSEYVAVSPFESMDRPVQFHHISCGRTFSKKPRAFLYENVRCFCEKNLTLEEAREYVENLGDFKLVSYKGMDQTARFYHAGCNREFDFNFRKFLQHPGCKLCDPKNRSKESFVQEIQQLTGNEYTLISEYVDSFTPVTLRHEKCGREFSIKPYHFAEGFRCTKCSGLLREEDFRKEVETISNGAYKIKRRLGVDKYELLETSTGYIFELPPRRILQELKRPTPSKLLTAQSVDQPEVSQTFSNTVKSCKEYVISIMNEHELLFMEDVPTELFDYAAVVKPTFSRLSKSGILERVLPGIYKKKGCEFANEDIIYQRYVQRKDRIIGYYAGPCLAYQLGLLEEDPHSINIKTNKEAQKHGRTVSVKGTKVKIAASVTTVTAENAPYLQILDLIQMGSKYIPSNNERKKIADYIQQNNLNYDAFCQFLSFYPAYTKGLLDRIYRETIWREAYGSKNEA